MTDHNDNRALTLALTDKNGVKYYEFRDERLLPPKRAMAALTFTRFAEMRLTEERLNTILDEMEKLFNSGHFLKAGALIEELRLSQQLFAEPQTLADLATVFFVVEGEDALEFDPDINKTKKDYWSKDADARAFFLQRAYQKTTLYTEQPNTNLTEYFNGVAEILKRFSRFDVTSSKGTI